MKLFDALDATTLRLQANPGPSETWEEARRCLNEAGDWKAVLDELRTLAEEEDLAGLRSQYTARSLAYQLL